MKYEDLLALPEDQRAEALAKAFNEKNTENKSLRDRLKKENPNALRIYESLKTRFGVEEVDDALLDQLQQTSSNSMTMEQKLKQLEKSMQKKNEEHAQVLTELSATKQKQLERDRDSMVLSELGKIGVRGDAMVDAQRIVALDSSYDADSMSWSFAGKDISSYMAEFSKSRQYWIQNPVKGGSGNSGSYSFSHNNTDPDFITEAEYMALSPLDRQKPEIRKKAHYSMDKWGKA